ncbi:MAG: hypothetical protein LAT58_01345 [Opitutales bacterium]|nr:hypothetical protein [Opitutales bacterium]
MLQVLRDVWRCGQVGHRARICRNRRGSCP